MLLSTTLSIHLIMLNNKGGRKLGEYKVGSTKNHDKIPSSHECKDCFRRKDTTNFYVRRSNNDSGWFVARRCNQCVSVHAKGIEVQKGYNKLDVRKARRNAFRERFKEMIWK